MGPEVFQPASVRPSVPALARAWAGEAGGPGGAELYEKDAGRPRGTPQGLAALATQQQGTASEMHAGRLLSDCLWPWRLVVWAGRGPGRALGLQEGQGWAGSLPEASL